MLFITHLDGNRYLGIQVLASPEAVLPLVSDILSTRESSPTSGWKWEWTVDRNRAVRIYSSISPVELATTDHPISLFIGFVTENAYRAYPIIRLQPSQKPGIFPPLPPSVVALAIEGFFQAADGRYITIEEANDILRQVLNILDLTMEGSHA